AKFVTCTNRERATNASPPTLASALEYKGEQRELSRATWRGGSLHIRRPGAGSRSRWSLQGECKNSQRSCGKNRHDGFRRSRCPLHLGENAGWPDELANVRSHAARLKRGHHARQRFWRTGRRVLSHFCFQ